MQTYINNLKYQPTGLCERKNNNSSDDDDDDENNNNNKLTLCSSTTKTFSGLKTCIAFSAAVSATLRSGHLTQQSSQSVRCSESCR